MAKLAKQVLSWWFASLLLLFCGKTESDATPVHSGGASGVGTGGAGNVAGTGGGATGGVPADANTDACGAAGWAGYENSTCCPGVPNCGTLTQWYCSTAPCVEACPLPKLVPGAACPVGRVCYVRSDVGCYDYMCLCDGTGWSCGGGDCSPGCTDGVEPNSACNQPGKVCSFGPAMCTCENGAWACKIESDAG